MTLVRENQAGIERVSPTAPPAVVIEQATEWADHLMQIVEDKELYQVIGKKKYLLAEAWQIVTTFGGAHAVPESVSPMKDADGEVIGYEAKVNLLKGGEIVGAGIMSCGFEEFPCRGKKGIAKHRAAMSAAETWATAKAARLNYSWVVVLAGYEATPADEMRDSDGSSEPQVQLQQRPDRPVGPLCDEHRVAYFKRGKMTGYAHPLEDGTGWHNMPDEDDAPTPQPEVARERVPSASGMTPDQMNVPDDLSGEGFQAMAKRVGWDRDQVAHYLGGTAAEWIKQHKGKTHKDAWVEAAQMWRFGEDNPLAS